MIRLYLHHVFLIALLIANLQTLLFLHYLDLWFEYLFGWWCLFDLSYIEMMSCRMGLIQVGGNGACSSKKKDQHMPLRVPPSAGRAAAGCTNCSTIVVKLCSEVLIYLPQKFWLDENINLPRRSGLYPDYQPFRRQFSKVFVSLIRIRVDVVPPRP
jgi:hypothetical protein